MMISKKRILSLTLVAAFVLSAFSGCVGGTQSKGSNEAADGTVSIRMSSWNNGTAPEYGKTVDAFMAENPDIKVEMVDISANEYHDKMTVMLSSGDDVDAICIYDLYDLMNYRTRNQIASLDEYVKKDNIDLAPYGGAIVDCTLEEQIYALPYRSDFYLTYYNKDIFDAAQVPYPSNDMTWDEFREIAKKLTTGEAADKVYGAYVHDWPSNVQMWSTLGVDYDLTSGKYTMFKPYYDRVLAMQNEDKSIMDFATIKTSSAHYSSQFETGKAGMVVMGTFFIGRLVSDKIKGEYDGNWGLVRAPHDDNYPAGATTAGTVPIALNSKSKNPDAAWKFIKFMATEPGAEIFAANGALPGYRTDAVMDVYANLDGMPEGTKEAMVTTLTKNDFPPVDNAAEIDQILEEEHDLIMLGEQTVDEGIAAMESRVNAVING